MSQTRGILLAFLAGAALAFGIDWARHDARIDRLKATADSVQTVQAAKDSVARAFVDSVDRAVAASKAAEDRAKADAATARQQKQVFHDALHALVDSNAAAKAALDSLEAAHEREVAGLRSALTLADAQVVAMRASRDTLQRRVDDLNASIAVLAHQINDLKAGPPKWVKIGLETVKLVGVAYAGYHVGKKS